MHRPEVLRRVLPLCFSLDEVAVGAAAAGEPAVTGHLGHLRTDVADVGPRPAKPRRAVAQKEDRDHDVRLVPRCRFLEQLDPFAGQTARNASVEHLIAPRRSGGFLQVQPRGRQCREGSAGVVHARAIGKRVTEKEQSVATCRLRCGLERRAELEALIANLLQRNVQSGLLTLQPLVPGRCLRREAKARLDQNRREQERDHQQRQLRQQAPHGRTPMRCSQASRRCIRTSTSSGRIAARSFRSAGSRSRS